MKQPHPYQIEGAAFLANGGALLADEAGLGKTIQAIEAMKALGARRVLVLCPAVALGVWRDEIGDCWPACEAVLVRDAVTGKHPQYVEGSKATYDMPWAFITGYEYLLRNERAQALVVEWQPFDVLILDEAHRLKEPTTQTTMMVYGAQCAGGPGSLVRMAEHTILLTATPQLNHPGEWWPHLRALAPERLESTASPEHLSVISYWAYTRKFCTFKTRTITMTKQPGQARAQTKQIETIDGANRDQIPDLARRLRGFWLRRKISDVRGELPPVQVVPRSIEPELCDARWLTEAEDSDEAKLLRRALEQGTPEALSAIEGQVSRLRRLLSAAKVPATIAWVEDLLDQGVTKVGVWGYHVEPLRAIRDGLAEHGSVLVTGETHDNIGTAKRFQVDPSLRVFVGQIVAGGQSIDLDAASRVVFHEQMWTPALNYQALMRHRRAAKAEVKPLLVEVLAVRGSLDHAVAEILARKSADIVLLEESM